MRILPVLIAFLYLGHFSLFAASPSVISISGTSVSEGDTGQTQMVFQVHVSPPSTVPISFTYGTINATAFAGLDYESKGETLTLPAGVTNAAFVVLAKGDTIPEGDESFLVILSSPINAALKTNLVTGTIRDNDFRLMIGLTTGSASRLTFASVNNRQHSVERTLILNQNASWEPMPGATSITGNGGLVHVNDPTAETQLSRFYRVRLLPRQTTNLAITYVGHAPLGDYRTTTAAKPLDPDGNAVFGTAGYVMYATDAIGSGNSGTTVIVNPLTYTSGTRVTRLSLPGWLTVHNNGQDRIAASYGSYPAIDNPSLAPAPFVNDVKLGYAVRLAAYNIEVSMINIQFANGVPSGGVRIGVACPAAGLDAIEAIRVDTSNVGATALRTASTSHILYFFDVVGAKAGDLITLRLRKSSATGGNQNVAYVGLTFDALPSL